MIVGLDKSIFEGQTKNSMILKHVSEDRTGEVEEGAHPVFFVVSCDVVRIISSFVLSCLYLVLLTYLALSCLVVLS